MTSHTPPHSQPERAKGPSPASPDPRALSLTPGPQLSGEDAPHTASLDGYEGNVTGAVYGGGGAKYGGAYPQDRVHLSDYARVFYRRRWPALTTFTLTMLACALSFSSGPPLYEARAQLLIDRETPSVASMRELGGPLSYTDEAYYQTQLKILQSRSLARRTLTSLGLWDKPPFGGRAQAPVRPAAPGTVAIIRSTVGDAWSTWVVTPIGRWFGRAEKPPQKEPPLPDETTAQAHAIDVLLGGLSITQVRNSRLVDVKYRSDDPALPALIADGVAKEYIALNLDYRFSASKDASDWLAERMREQRQRLEESEQALQRYKETHNTVSLDDKQNIVLQKLSDLNTAVTKTKTDRIQKEALYQEMIAAEKNGSAIDSLPAVLANPFVQQMKLEVAKLERQQSEISQKWGEMHPAMVNVQSAIRSAEDKLKGEIRRIVQALQNDYQAAVAQERSLTQLLDSQKQEALSLNAEGIGYGVLERDAAINRQIFDSLLQQSKETGISSELKATNIRVVDPAERPQGPIGTNSRTTWILALLGAVVLGFATALFFEYLDNRIKLPDEIETHLGIPFLGFIPSVPRPKGVFGRATPLLNQQIPAGFLESLRTVRTNVLFSSTAVGGKSLLVTSAAPGEGKTLVSCNLAIALAQSGRRVILVDADMRRPRVHSIFAQAQAPGLSNVLVGDARPSAAVQETGIPGLSLLTSGMPPPNPPELLGSRRFNALLAALVNEYDWVVLDSPPVIAVTDATLLADRVSRVVVVIAAEMTSTPVAKRAVRQLLRANARIAGAILNRVRVDRHRYYYSHYYNRKYETYYGQDQGSSGGTLRWRRSDHDKKVA